MLLVNITVLKILLVNITVIKAQVYTLWGPTSQNYRPLSYKRQRNCKLNFAKYVETEGKRKKRILRIVSICAARSHLRISISVLQFYINLIYIFGNFYFRKNVWNFRLNQFRPKWQICFLRFCFIAFLVFYSTFDDFHILYSLQIILTS